MGNSLYLVLILAFFWMTSAKYVPDEKAYAEDTKLMINICNKFAEEPDAKALHKAVVATQYARVINCMDYNNECNLYGKFLSLATRVSADDDISSAERIEMRAKLDELKAAISAGRIKLNKEHR
jgi:hypothetical protein